MKGFFCSLLIILALSVASCSSKSKSEKGYETLNNSEIDAVEPITTIKFGAVEHDFGQVKEGEKVVCTYEVVNTGKVDLLIHDVKVSCGCTTPKYDKKPIPPGKKGYIEVSFDTKNRPGMQRKSLVAVANTEPSNNVLTFTCEVIPK